MVETYSGFITKPQVYSFELLAFYVSTGGHLIYFPIVLINVVEFQCTPYRLWMHTKMKYGISNFLTMENT